MSLWRSRYEDDGLDGLGDAPRSRAPPKLTEARTDEILATFTGAADLWPLTGIAPTETERTDGWFYLGKHLDMFWTFDMQGESYLDGKLKALDIETIALVGLWTDEGLSYFQDGVVAGKPGAVKGTEHPDGRKVG